MIKEIKLPEIAENIDVATVISINVSEGDAVEADQTIAEMESDKAAFDLPSTESGTVKSIEVKEGDEVKVGQTVVTIEVNGEEKKGKEEKEEKEEKEKEKEQKDEKGKKEGEQKDTEDVKDKEREEEEASQKKKKKEKEELEAEKEEEQQEPEQEKEQEESREEIPAAPSVRRLAREIGVDIRRVEGSGPYDRILAEDVKNYAKSRLQKDREMSAGQPKMPDFSQFGETERKPMDTVRKRTAQNMTSSWQNIPHVFQFDKADITGMEKFRKKHSKKVEEQGGALTLTSILLKITAKALEKFPKFNASLDLLNEEIVYKKYINIGVAVDTERGLIVPVIREPDKKTITELSVELTDVAEKTRNKKIMPDVLQGGNFAISNLGGIGGTNFTPIVYQPNVAILGISRAAMEPVYRDDEFQPRLMLPLSLSYDHRLIDGAEAARFLRWICEALEDPFLTLF